jgi:hypothetical protein
MELGLYTPIEPCDCYDGMIESQHFHYKPLLKPNQNQTTTRIKTHWTHFLTINQSGHH